MLQAKPSTRCYKRLENCKSKGTKRVQVAKKTNYKASSRLLLFHCSHMQHSHLPHITCLQGMMHVAGSASRHTPQVTPSSDNEWLQRALVGATLWLVVRRKGRSRPSRTLGPGRGRDGIDAFRETADVGSSD